MKVETKVYVSKEQAKNIALAESKLRPDQTFYVVGCNARLGRTTSLYYIDTTKHIKISMFDTRYYTIRNGKIIE